MKLLRVPVMPLSSGQRELEEPESRYLHKVHRLDAGAQFLAFDPLQRVEARARITRVGRRVSCAIDELVELPAPSQQLCLVYALAKGDKLDQVVRDATALGATAIVLAATERSVVRLDAARAAERLRRLQGVAVESARQCGRGDLPLIEGPFGWLDALARRSAPGDTRLILSPEAEQPLGRVLAGWTPDTPISVAVGPEGGFAAPELAAAEDAGFTPVSLGPLTLRTETAAVAALAAVLAARDSIRSE